MPEDRFRPDACPGALHVHEAADGALSRLRLPGGHLTSEQLLTLAQAAEDLGNGEIELTSRANVQLRSVREPGALAQRVAAAGLLPSATHERVRNIVGSPLSGRVGGIGDIRAVVRDLDQALIARPRLAALPGRVLFTLDDGRGDISPLRGDFGVHALAPDHFALLLAGEDCGARISAAQIVPTLLDAAQAFLDVRGEHWRLHELDDGPAQVFERLELQISSGQPVQHNHEVNTPIGWFDQHDGKVTLGATVALGVLPARMAQFLAATSRPVIITPWRSLLLVDLDEAMADQVIRVLAPMGLIFDAHSPWAQVSACTGSPGCAKSHADVRADVAEAVIEGTLPVHGRQHWSGCDRRCGSPHGDAADIIATGSGYIVAGGS